jgi:hypothetical protein
LYAYERSLVEKYQDRAFVLLGVNTDVDRDAARQVVARRRLNWRSWWAGGPDGAIPSRWRINSFPSLFIIDGHGVVRYEHIQPGPELERAIESLLRELRETT